MRFNVAVCPEAIVALADVVPIDTPSALSAVTDTSAVPTGSPVNVAVVCPEAIAVLDTVCVTAAPPVGVVIGLMQTLTQIQEPTLVSAPKIVAIFVSLLIFLPFMGALMSGFMRHIAARISAM